MKVRGKRMLLNNPGIETTAAIVAEVEDTRGWKDGCYRRGGALDWDDETPWNLTPESRLQLSDCSRSIMYTIQWETAAQRRGALAKVDRMIGALTAFREGLAEEQALYVARLAEAKRAGPPKKKVAE